ncbi:MAG: hypothetical protein DCF20_04090 [Pseudanabaena sp.]|nr:MAG: hypothetical protein DCF20_04090 [Pseudanabaena sp.]
MFEIQNQVLMYQSDNWQKMRISKLQGCIIELQDFISKVQTLLEERMIIIEKKKNSSHNPFVKRLWSRLKSTIKSFVNIFTKQS